MDQESTNNTPGTEWPTGPIVSHPKPFVDERGEIQSLFEGPITAAQIITSKAGSVRANHYHKTDWHYCHMLSGSMRYYHRPVGSKEAPQWVLVKEGQGIFTPPDVEHAMEFIEDSAFLNLTHNTREQENYESDLVRVELIKAEK